MSKLEGTFVGPYYIKRLLGHGGMSDVYLAYDEAMQRDVALKMMSGYSRDSLERFRREAEAIDKLHHEHILPALDYEESNDWHYLAMMYVPEGTLRDLLKAGPLSLEETATIFLQVADAVQFAHDHGVLHRDIKPSNILMWSCDYVYLADFGLAKIVEGEGHLTLSGTLMGTPEYMAPDLANGAASVSTDVYALGVVLYQMLTGYVPFDGDTPISIFWKHLREIAVPPSRFNPQIPPQVDRVVMRALSKRPQRRYASANELAAAYIQAISGGDSSLDGDVEEEFVDEPLDSEDLLPYDVDEPLDAADFGEAALPGPVALDEEDVLVGDGIGVGLTGNPLYVVDEPVAVASRRARYAYPLRHARKYITTRGSYLYQNVRKRVVHRRYTSDMQGYIPPYTRRTRRRSSSVPSAAMLATSTPQMLDGQAVGKPHAVPARRHRVRAGRSHVSARRRKGQVAFIVTLGIFIVILLPLLVFSILGHEYTTVVESAANSSSNAQAVQGAPAPAALILQDSLVNNTSGRWSEAPQNCVFTQQSYHVIVSQSSQFQPCSLITPLLDNGALSVDVSLVAGNSAGMVLRLHGDQYYDFQITQAGEFFFRRHDANAGNHYTNLVATTKSAAIKPGKAINRLLVIANGSDFKLYINTIFVGEVHDTTYAQGQLAFIAHSLTLGNAEGVFTNLKIQKIS